MTQRLRRRPERDVAPILAEVAPVRQASRQLVRELGFLDRLEGDLSHSQCHVLIELERQGVMTGGELAAVLNLDKSTMSRALAGLLRARLITARSRGGDRRRRPLTLTARGTRKLAAIHQAANRQVHSALALLTPEDRASAARGLELYARALSRLRARQEFSIRPIARKDDPDVARIIRTVMTEFGASGLGFAIHDPEVDRMSAAYGGAGHGYYVLERAGRVVGGAGFGPLTGAEAGVCELRKMYFMPEARGTGMGAALLAQVLGEARRAGHDRCYLETLRSMKQARRLYEAFGFARIDGAMGATGHFSCDAWYLKPLDG